MMGLGKMGVRNGEVIDKISKELARKQKNNMLFQKGEEQNICGF